MRLDTSPSSAPLPKRAPKVLFCAPVLWASILFFVGIVRFLKKKSPR